MNLQLFPLKTPGSVAMVWIASVILFHPELHAQRNSSLIKADSLAERGRFSEALLFYKQALEVAGREKDTFSLLASCDSAAQISYMQGKYEDSQQIFFKLLRLYEATGRAREQARTLESIGDTFVDQRNYSKSYTFYKNAETIYARTLDSAGLARIVNALALLKWEQDSIEEAREQFQVVLRYYPRHQSLTDIAAVYINVGLTYDDEKKFEEAGFYYQKGIALREAAPRDAENLYNLAGAYTNMSRVHRYQNRREEAFKLLYQALSLSKQISSDKKRRQVYQKLYETHHTFANYDSSYYYFKRYYKLSDSIYDQSRNEAIAEMEAVYQLEKKQADIQRLAAENRLAAVTYQNNVIKILLGGGVLLIAAGVLYFRQRQRVLQKDADLKQLSLRVTETRQIALRAQMNPHFIFNCMAAADGLIASNEKQKASVLITTFATLVRQVLEKSDRALVTLEDELESLKLYIALEQLRFSDPFKVVQEIEPEALMCEIPPLLVQPYVENAILHGLRPRTGSKVLEINASFQASLLVIKVRDNGVGRSAASLSRSNHQSMGTRLTDERVALLKQAQGIDASVEIHDLAVDNVAAGTEVVMMLRYNRN